MHPEKASIFLYVLLKKSRNCIEKKSKKVVFEKETTFLCGNSSMVDNKFFALNI